MTNPEVDVLTGFLDEFHRALDLELDDAQATETRCWHAPLRDAMRALDDDADGLDPARAALAIGKLAVDDESWPLPNLLGRALLNLDALASVAGDELHGLDASTPDLTAAALAHFQESFQELRDQALRAALVDGTLELTRLVRAVQTWRATLSLAAATDPHNPGAQALIEEAAVAREGLLTLLEQLSRTSTVDGFRSALGHAVDEAAAYARERMQPPKEDGVVARARRRWSETQAGALSTLRRRRKDAVQAKVALWTAHHEGLWVRLDLQRRLVSLQATTRDRLDAGLETLEAQSVTPVRDHLGRVIASLQAAKAEAKSRSEGASASDWSSGVELVEGLHAKAAAALDQALEALGALPLVDAGLSVVDRCIGACHGAPGELPERVQAVELEEADVDDWPLAAHATLTPREWAERAYDIDRMSAVRAALIQVADVIRDGVEQAQKAPEILSYNLEAALDEMRLAASSGHGEEDPWQLVDTGLDRTADFLDRIVESVDAAYASARRMARDEIDAGSIELLARFAREDAWSAELSDAWNDALDRARGIGRGVLRGGARTATATRRGADAAFSRARTALERARQIIRGGSGSAGSDQTIRELSAVDAQAGALPFVYRRLFSPRPLEDPTLFVGQDEHVEAILRHWSDWKAGRRNSLVVTAAFGGGMRSLVAAVASRSGEPTVWRRAALETRVDNEAALVRILAGAILDEESSRGLDTLDALATALAGIDTPLAVHVERFEHLLERTVEGFALAEEALEFFSRTDTYVGWFITMPSDAWSLFRTVSPSSAALVRTHAVGPLDEGGLKEMLAVRHQRSGLALEYDAASVPQTALRDRKEQSAVERAFYARFWELTDGSAPLALLYWIRSASYEPDSEHVTLRWPEPLDFSFLEDLSWDQAFALQAFAEHGTLTVADHARIFSTSADRSYEVLESLGNLYLIEPAGAIRRVGEQLSFTTVTRAESYRIRPVLQPVVRRLLKARRLTS